MENDKSHKEELSKILGLEYPQISPGTTETASWAEIYIEIGKLIERAKQNDTTPYPITYPTNTGTSPVHYHNGSPCYNNQCVGCSPI